MDSLKSVGRIFLMNDLYGIDPKAPSSLNELSSLIRLFSPYEGRFIADFPLGWGNELRIHMSTVSDICRMATVDAWLRLGSHAILPIKHQYKSSMTWSENSAFIRNEVVKLIGSSGESSSSAARLADVLVDPDAFRDSRAGLIPRTARAYSDVARPILLRSRKVVLVDPYFTFRYKANNSSSWRYDRRRDVVKAMLKIALAGKYVECFEIFYVPENKDVYGSDHLDSDLRDLALEIGFDGLEVAARPIKKYNNTKHHARYLLGLKSGLHFDHGFDTSDDGSTNHVEWMSQAVLDPLLEKFT